MQRGQEVRTRYWLRWRRPHKQLEAGRRRRCCRLALAAAAAALPLARRRFGLALRLLAAAAAALVLTAAVLGCTAAAAGFTLLLFKLAAAALGGGPRPQWRLLLQTGSWPEGCWVTPGGAVGRAARQRPHLAVKLLIVGSKALRRLALTPGARGRHGCVVDHLSTEWVAEQGGGSKVAAAPAQPPHGTHALRPLSFTEEAAQCCCSCQHHSPALDAPSS